MNAFSWQTVSDPSSCACNRNLVFVNQYKNTKTVRFHLYSSQQAAVKTERRTFIQLSSNVIIYLYNRTVAARLLTVRSMWPDDLYIVIKVMRLYFCTSAAVVYRGLKGVASYDGFWHQCCFIFSYECFFFERRSQISKYTVAPLHVLFLFPCMFYLNVACGRCRRRWALIGHNCEADDHSGFF